VEQSIEDTDEPGTRLRKDLTWWDLIVFGVSVVIGAGIFTVTASTAGGIIGPAISISFVLAAFACGLAALCYAEFASTVPVAGSAYTFSYASFGEVVAWIIGWDLVLEFAVGAATVVKSWSTYLGEVFGFAGGEIALGPLNLDWGAVVIVAIVTTLLALGTKLSSNVSAVITLIKVTVVLVVIVVGAFYIKAANYTPFVPPAEPGGGAGGSRCSRCSPARVAATMAGTACWQARRSCSSRSSDSTSSRPLQRRPRIRSATCPAESSERWPSSPCSMSRWRWCCPE
jgi:basic amino acid/polyamine antiporter, APA family